jgi:hypothetical protein
LHPAPAAPFSSIGGAHFQALRKLATIFDTALPHASTGNSVHVLLHGTNIAPSPGCQSSSHSDPVPPATPTSVQCTIPNARSSVDGPQPISISDGETMSCSISVMGPSWVPFTRVSPSQSPPAVPTIPHHLRHQQPSPRAHGMPYAPCYC